MTKRVTVEEMIEHCSYHACNYDGKDTFTAPCPVCSAIRATLKEHADLEQGNKNLTVALEYMTSQYAALKEEKGKLISEWFEKGRKSVLRTNKSGCCCEFDEAEDEVVSLCAAHAEYFREQKAVLEKENAELRDLQKILNEAIRDLRNTEIELTEWKVSVAKRAERLLDLGESGLAEILELLSDLAGEGKEK